MTVTRLPLVLNYTACLPSSAFFFFGWDGMISIVMSQALAFIAALLPLETTAKRELGCRPNVHTDAAVCSGRQKIVGLKEGPFLWSVVTNTVSRRFTQEEGDEDGEKERRRNQGSQTHDGRFARKKEQDVDSVETHVHHGLSVPRTRSVTACRLHRRDYGDGDPCLRHPDPECVSCYGVFVFFVLLPGRAGNLFHINSCNCCPTSPPDTNPLLDGTNEAALSHTHVLLPVPLLQAGQKEPSQAKEGQQQQQDEKQE